RKKRWSRTHVYQAFLDEVERVGSRAAADASWGRRAHLPVREREVFAFNGALALIHGARMLKLPHCLVPPNPKGENIYRAFTARPRIPGEECLFPLRLGGSVVRHHRGGADAVPPEPDKPKGYHKYLAMNLVNLEILGVFFSPENAKNFVTALRSREELYLGNELPIQGEGLEILRGRKIGPELLNLPGRLDGIPPLPEDEAAKFWKKRMSEECLLEIRTGRVFRRWTWDEAGNPRETVIPRRQFPPTTPKKTESPSFLDDPLVLAAKETGKFQRPYKPMRFESLRDHADLPSIKSDFTAPRKDPGGFPGGGENKRTSPPAGPNDRPLPTDPLSPGPLPAPKTDPSERERENLYRAAVREADVHFGLPPLSMKKDREPDKSVERILAEERDRREEAERREEEERRIRKRKRREEKQKSGNETPGTIAEAKDGNDPNDPSPTGGMRP
ncbi:MAG: hypothetical protein LBF41_06240, partial [Deltaproteobacteria bacterium]|nr:hypothetical protein [Deltaproteobacteria bacterium]